MGKIYDCFNFFNELDILELRLNILYEYVDYFVIVESDVTHSGEKKPFYFEDNKERYSKFLGLKQTCMYHEMLCDDKRESHILSIQLC